MLMIALLQCILHVLGASYMATGIMSIYLAAMLHRRHTIMFVQWVSSNRWVPNPEAKPLPHSDPNTGTIKLVAETTPATGTSSAQTNPGDNIQGVAETAAPVGAPSTKGDPAPTATGEKIVSSNNQSVRYESCLYHSSQTSRIQEVLKGVPS